MHALIENLVRIAGAAGVLTEPADVAACATDCRGHYKGSAVCVVRPGNVEEVAAVVACCLDHSVPIQPPLLRVRPTTASLPLIPRRRSRRVSPRLSRRRSRRRSTPTHAPAIQAALQISAADTTTLLGLTDNHRTLARTSRHS